jgi:RNA polymerase sigma-70 factor (ECF subfamily)
VAARDAGRARTAAVVTRHAAFVWRILRRAGLSPADAEDATQDVLWILLQRLDAVPPASERGFLTATALRVAADRRRSKWRSSVTEPLDPDLTADTLSPEEAVDLRHARALLDEALEALDQDEREVFVLVELEQMTREEVAATLGLAPGTVASRLRRAREAFEAATRRIRLRQSRRGP